MNPRAWFAPLVMLPDVITEPGDYVTRAGEVVRVHTVSPRHAFACRGTYPNGTPDAWHKSGRLYFDTLSNNDITRRA